ncbi:MAG: DUF2207 domain-containing protein [Bacilli bacterium]|nr:DUF2207 domain-containing protein [Bacilli bacterium]
MKKITYLLILLFPLIVLASNDYDIEKYQIDVTVNKNHTYNYQEEIEVKFFGNEKYIVRNMNDQEHSFKVDKNYTIETNETSIAKLYSRYNADTYTINYDIEAKEGKNNLYEFEIENNYDNDINSVTFNIELPNPVTVNNITIYNGNYDITELVDFTVKGNTVTGTYNKKIATDQSILVVVDYGKFYMSSATVICIVIPFILTVFSYLLWRLFGKDLPTRIEKTSKFSRNITPLHLALADHGKITDEDNYYMLLNLASKGYLTIVEEKEEYYLKKNKEYRESNYTEALFFKTIFRAGESISLTEYLNIVSEKKDNKSKIYQADRVESKYLKRKYKIASDTIKKYLEEQNEQEKYFEDKPEKIKNILLLMIALILVLITSLPFIEINTLSLLPLSVILSIFILYILIKFVKNVNVKSKKDKTSMFLALLLTILVVCLIPSFQRNIGFLIAFLVSLICSFIILVIYKYMPKRTIYGQGIYNKREGFINFINTITKEELDRIQELNENYLLEILPISYQLGVSDKVIDLLRKNNIPKPEWFIIPDKFNYTKLNKSILNLKEKLTKEDN